MGVCVRVQVQVGHQGAVHLEAPLQARKQVSVLDPPHRQGCILAHFPRAYKTAILGTSVVKVTGVGFM